MNQQTARPSIRRFLCSGEFDENCYVVSALNSRECLVIDPGAGLDEAVEFMRNQGVRPTAAVCTHGHLDHIMGVPELLAAYPEMPVMIGRPEADALHSPTLNLSSMLGMPIRLGLRPSRLLDDGDELTVAGLSLRVIATPGHSPGGICLYCQASGDLFTGDVLFDHGIGRTDLPNADHQQLLQSIRKKLLTLPASTRIWPGHGPDATLATCGFG